MKEHKGRNVVVVEMQKQWFCFC